MVWCMWLFMVILPIQAHPSHLLSTTYFSFQLLDPWQVCRYFYISCCLFFFLKPHLQHMEVPGPGVKSELHLQSIPQPQQHWIWATSVTHAEACSNAGSLSYWGRSGIEAVCSQRCHWVLNMLNPNENSPHCLDFRVKSFHPVGKTFLHFLAFRVPLYLPRFWPNTKISQWKFLILLPSETNNFLFCGSKTLYS